jgi:hypothetical protein
VVELSHQAGVGGLIPLCICPSTGIQARAHFREIPKTFFVSRGRGVVYV